MPYSSIGMTQHFEQDTKRLSRAFQLSARRVNGEVDEFMHLLSRTALDSVQRKSFGVVDPTEKFPHLAWKIPVRRITGEYYRGWKVRRSGKSKWIVYNNTREAYFIELGIHRSPRRVRRPIAKMTVIEISKRLPLILHRFGPVLFAFDRQGAPRSYTGGGGL